MPYLLLILWLGAITTPAAPATAQTATALEVIGFRESRYDDAPAIDVRFSAPVSDQRAINDQVYLVDTDNGRVAGEWLVSDEGRKLTFPFIEPERNYELRVLGSLRSTTGQPIVYPETLTLRTRRLEPVASFASRGFVLARSSRRGLPVSVVNVDAVDVDFFRVDDLAAFMKSGIHPGDVSHYRLRSLDGTATLVHSGRFDLKPRKNQRTVANIDISRVSALGRPGVFVAVLRGAGQYPNQASVIYFSISDIGLHVRRYADHFDAYVNDIDDGQPLNGVELTLYDHKGDAALSSTTDDHGRARLPVMDNASFLIAIDGREATLLPIDRRPLDLSEFRNATSIHSNLQTFSWGPRDLYRPGEVVTINMLLRDHDGRRVSDIPVNIEVLRPDGSKAGDTLVQPAGAGFYSLDYAVPVSAATGAWRVQYRLGNNLSLPQTYHFSVEEFHPQRLKVDVMPGHVDVPRLIHSAEIEIPVQGDYLFGAPASGNRVDGHAVIGFERHPFPAMEHYFFGIDGEQIRLSRTRLAAIALDAEGSGKLQLQNHWADLHSPLRVSLAVSVYESAGRPVTGKRDLILLRDSNHVGIDPLFKERPDANSQIDFSVAAVTGDGAPRAGTDLDMTLTREDRTWFWSYASHRGWYWDFDASPYTAWTGRITTGPDGRATVSVPVTSGYYRLRVTDADGAMSDFSFETAGRWWNNVTHANNAPGTIFLGLDRDTYVGGETARVSFVSPHTGSGLLTVESSAGVLHREIIDITDTNGTLEIAIDPRWDRHDLYLGLMVLKPSTERDAVSPQRALGLAHLPLTRPNFEIDLDLSVPDKVRPGQTVTARVQVDPERPGSPVYLVAALVDVGILNLTGIPTPRPERWFHAPRRYQVDLYDMYGDIIENRGLGRVRQKFGGGFGDEQAMLHPGTTRDPAEVQLVAYSAKPVAVDPSGTAEISFEIPDFDGRLKWMVVAFSDDQFGSADAYTTVASPVVVQLSHPHYLAPGDQSLLAVDVTNLSGSSRSLTLELAQSDGLTHDQSVRTLALTDGARHTFTVDLHALQPFAEVPAAAPGRLNLHLTSADGSLSMTREVLLPVRNAFPAVTRIERVRQPAGDTWRPSLQVDDLRPDSLLARLTLSRYPAIDVSGQMSALLNYPYGCLEQVVSRAQPWLTVSQSMIDHFGAAGIILERFEQPFSESLRREQLIAAVRSIGALQRPDGGFSQWQSNGPENLWLTVYATDFLVRASKLGVMVPGAMLHNALGRLLSLVRRPGLRQSWVPDQAQYEFAIGAYASFVLARAGRISLSDVRRLLASTPTELNQSGLPWMHLGLALHLLGDSERSKVAFARAASSERRQSDYLGDYGSALRDTAWILRYMAEFNVDVPVDPIRLAAEYRDRRWLSTQERAHLLGLAAAWESRGENVDATLILTGGNTRIQRDGPYATVISADEHERLQGITPNHEALYGEYAVAGVPRKALDPVAEHMTVSKRYFTLDGSAADLDDLHPGDMLVVRLQVSAPEPVPDAIIVDLLPAGIELENQNLVASSLDLASMIFDDDGSRLTPNHQVRHEEFREDRYVAALELTGGRMQRVFYLARVVTPGRYTVPPAYAEDMYRPWRFSIGRTRQLTVTAP
ncbi:MAG: alpha-2-macroglobulin [Proteobacteria bacterium]|nr:alpha-2-macroglobulin [Pseudomonadota bacterium]